MVKTAYVAGDATQLDPLALLELGVLLLLAGRIKIIYSKLSKS